MAGEDHIVERIQEKINKATREKKMDIKRFREDISSEMEMRKFVASDNVRTNNEERSNDVAENEEHS